MRLGLRLQRRLADAERLHRDANLSVHAQHAHPALSLVLGGAGERHGGLGEREHDGRVLEKAWGW